MMNFSRPMVLLALMAVFIVAGIAGGPGNSLDVAVNAVMAGLRKAHPQLTSFAAVLTQLGSIYATLGLGLLASALLALRGRRHAALLLAAAIILERLSADGLKLAIGRARPSLDLLPLMPTSSSFPSGHSANSMAVFTAIALIAVPMAWRCPALALAIGLAILIGLTRIFLGVHWPSDVIGGWAWGLFVVGLALALGKTVRRDRSGA